MDEQAVSDAIADPATYTDMNGYHELFKRLRREAPVRWTEPESYRPFWTVSRHEHVMEIELQPRVFVNAPRTALRTVQSEEEIRLVTGSTQAARTLIQMDDPDHRKFRKLTQSWFLPGRLHRLDDQLAALATEFVDRLDAAGGTCDFATDIAVWYPLRVIMAILGVPEEHGPMMLRLTQQHFAGQDPTVSRGERVDAGAPARELFAYFTDLTVQRRQNPSDDIVSLLADAQIDGKPISDFDRNSYFFIMAIAGHDTTSSTISGLMHALITHPDQLEKLRADRGLLPSAVTEGIRWTSPVRHFFRTATADYTIGGQTIKAGDSVMLAYPSANFDDAVFDEPFDFRVDREPNSQIAFGHGVHVCLGQHLARNEITALFAELLDRVGPIEMTAEARWLETSFVGGIKSLPISYRMATHA